MEALVSYRSAKPAYPALPRAYPTESLRLADREHTNSAFVGVCDVIR